MMVKQKRETGRSIGKQIKHKGIAQNRERDLNWKHRINKGERNRFWPGDGARRREREGVRGRMTVQRRRRERERGRARCNLSQGPSAFLFYQQPIGPHTKRPLGFHSDGGHFAPRHPINSSRAVCNTVVMCCDTIYPPRTQRERLAQSSEAQFSNASKTEWSLHQVKTIVYGVSKLNNN